LEVLQFNKVSLIITDIKMPDMDGVAFLKALKERKISVPVVVVTAFHEEKTALEALQLGAVNYLVKPFELRKITKIVHQLVYFSHEKKNDEAFYVPPHYSFSVKIPSDYSYVPQMIRMIDDIFVEYNFAKRDRLLCRLALEELVENAIEHGNRNIRSKLVNVRGDITSSSVEFFVEDDGDGVKDDVDEFVKAYLHKGKGLFLINFYMDELELLPAGNCFRVKKKMHPPLF